MILSHFGISGRVLIQHDVFYCVYIQELELHYVTLSNFLFIVWRLCWICVGNSFLEFLSRELLLADEVTPILQG